MQDKYIEILKILKCNKCNTSMFKNESKNSSFYSCKGCNNFYPIIDGIIRCVPNNDWYKLTKESNDITEKTKNYFGFEWDYFSDWGFINDNLIRDGEEKFLGGTVKNRISAFNSKCRLSNQELNNKYILDAGCGNGRYSYEALIRSKGAFVIGVDLGYGSVKAAQKNCIDFPNFIIIQASLFDLPFRDQTIDSCFSNGVLMHTGNAELAFNEISRVIKSKGTFVAHLYGRLNFVWEINDFLIRSVTTKLSIKSNLIFARFMSKLSRIISKIPYGFLISNLFIRLQSTEHHMFDWYSAPIATHHTYRELIKWFKKNNFYIVDDIKKKIALQENVKPWQKPWSINLKGIKR